MNSSIFGIVLIKGLNESWFTSCMIMQFKVEFPFPRDDLGPREKAWAIPTISHDWLENSNRMNEPMYLLFKNGDFLLTLGCKPSCAVIPGWAPETG